MRPNQDVKIIFGIIALPILLWCSVAGFYLARSYTDRGLEIVGDKTLQVSTHLVGGSMRFADAFPDEIIVASDGNTNWSGTNYTVNLDVNSQVMLVKSSRFTSDVSLKYDGWRWQGFVNIPGRTLPVKVDVW